MSFCDRRKIDLLTASTTAVLEFLTELYQNGLGYSTINTAKSALSSFYCIIDGRIIGMEPLVQRFMKGVFTNKPSLPKHNRVWPIKAVLDYISASPENSELTLLQLSEKLATLFMILSGQRCQTIHLFKLDDLQIESDYVHCVISQLVKQTKPGLHVKPFTIERYSVDKKQCLVTTLVHYITRTKHLRQTDKLFISTVQPFNSVTKSTVGRWIKSLLQKAGIDITQFGAHSCRAASTSAASAKGVQIDTIMQAAGWSSAKTFRQFYNKTIDVTYAEALLS